MVQQHHSCGEWEGNDEEEATSELLRLLALRPPHDPA